MRDSLIRAAIFYGSMFAVVLAAFVVLSFAVDVR